MSWLILLSAVALILVVIVVIKTKIVGGSDEAWPFYAKKPLSQPEQVLYFRLTKALPEYIVLAQVQLSRLLGVKRGNNFHAWNNKINRMSADFVVCNKDSSVIAVIELDDASHARGNRQVADNKKDKALTSADIRIIRWQVKAMPDEATIKAAFLSNI